MRPGGAVAKAAWGQHAHKDTLVCCFSPKCALRHCTAAQHGGFWRYRISLSVLKNFKLVRTRRREKRYIFPGGRSCAHDSGSGVWSICASKAKMRRNKEHAQRGGEIKTAIKITWKKKALFEGKENIMKRTYQLKNLDRLYLRGTDGGKHPLGGRALRARP